MAGLSLSLTTLITFLLRFASLCFARALSLSDASCNSEEYYGAFKFRNPKEQVKRLLDTRHHDRYRIYNLSDYRR